MPVPHLLQGQSLPAVAAFGLPREDPMSDGVLPLGILQSFHFANQTVENLR